jgi:NADH-quinone oxidoreductase subunit L
MFLAMGVGAYAAGIFHLMTHAFFKGLLFLGAGSVIHGMGGEQDIRRMGGLRKKMPVTFLTFAIACCAIAGVPLFSGFFSKDAILYQAFTAEHGHPVLWAMGVAGAVLTAFYMFRLLFRTFLGEIRADAHTAAHVHESPASMTIPLVVLAVLSIAGGWIGLPAGWLWGDRFGEFLAPVVGAHHGHHDATLEYALMGASALAAAIGIATAYVFYVRSPELPGRVASAFRRTYELLLDKYRIDELYDATVVRATFFFGHAFWKLVDVVVIDGTVNGVGIFVRQQSRVWRLLQTGNVQHYALTFVVGAIVVVGFFLIG